MGGMISSIRNRLMAGSDDDSRHESTDVPESPETTLYECPACRVVFIEPSTDQCSQCRSATLEEV